MKIAQVTGNLDCGGAQKMVIQLSSELARLGNTVEVIQIDRPTNSAHEHVAIRALNRCGVPWYTLNRRLGFPGLIPAFKLWGLVHRNRYDLIHSHLPLTDAIVGFVRRLSVRRFNHVLTVHSTRESRSRFAAFWAEGAAAAYCSYTALPRTVLHPRASVVIPNGIPEMSPASDAGKIEVRRRLGIKAGAVVVIAVGNMHKSKNYGCGLAGLALLQEFSPQVEIHFIICGDGAERLSLQQRASKSALNGRTHFMGDITDVSNMLSGADIFLSTSLHEGMPLAVLEAFASGLPCVLSPIEEHLEVAGNMDGTIFMRENTPAAVAEAVKSLIDHSESLRSYAVGRKRELERFTMKRSAAAYLDLYQRLSSYNATDIGNFHLDAYGHPERDERRLRDGNPV